MEIINQDILFVEFRFNNDFKKSTYSLLKNDLISQFELISNDLYESKDFSIKELNPFHLIDYLLIKRQLPNRDDSRKKNFEYLKGITFNIAFFGKITEIEKGLKFLAEIVKSIEKRFEKKLESVKIYLSAELNEYKL